MTMRARTDTIPTLAQAAKVRTNRGFCRLSAALCAIATLITLTQLGCAGRLTGAVPGQGVSHIQPNPVTLPPVPTDFLWEQIVDELDNYFPIRREERIRQIRNQLTRGWIETYPSVGSSILEPWREDAVTQFDKWQGTFQSIRRWARVIVIPQPDGYDLQVLVFMELEDVDHPMNGQSAFAPRHSVSVHRNQDPMWYEPGSYGWIDLGRDQGLEQKILANIVSRLNDY